MTNNTITAIIRVTDNNKEAREEQLALSHKGGEGNWEPQFPLQYNPRMHRWE
tara:strand:- start:71 stop:226 length:156 start_codon:yes stop_codon:yes gene_type:complete